MDFKKLPSNSEQLLYKLVAADNPVQLLQECFETASEKEDAELRGIIEELCHEGYINVMWGDDMPYIVTLNNAARTYSELLAEYKADKMSLCASETQKMEPIIFISHRATDKAIADMLVDFFSGTGIPKETVFCSSLPGNDVNEKISNEVRSALSHSAVNIAVLSYDYYQSAYCLNEAGIIWFQDGVPAIPVALPEINSDDMYGFLSNEYKLRRLDCDTDISYIYDSVSEAISAQQAKVSVITYEMQKLKERYNQYLENRIVHIVTSSPATITEITTDDERIVLYYILKERVRRVSKDAVIAWLRQSEIYNVNVDNAFDLLSLLDGNSIKNDILEFGLDTFRRYSAEAESLLPELERFVKAHIKLASDIFNGLWDSDVIDATVGLFVAYIVEERMHTFGDRWMADRQIENIKKWEDDNSLSSMLSDNYGSCLELFKQHDLVYESGWTSYGNPREYTLCPSLQNLLFTRPEPYIERLEICKKENHFELPF